MFNNKMTLRQMVDLKPSDEDMMALPLEVIVYLKVSLISLNKDDNYDFIRFLFNDDELDNYFIDYMKTIFYDFDASKTNQEKYITIFELYGSKRYAELSSYLEELLNKYTHEADVIIDLYTHDNHEYRLSNLEGIVKLEELNIK